MYETAYSVCTSDFEEVAKCFYSKQGTVSKGSLLCANLTSETQENESNNTLSKPHSVNLVT